MKPLHYAIIGALAFAVVLASGIIIGRATKAPCPKPDIEAGVAWKSAAEGWRVVVEKGVQERAALKSEVHALDSMLKVPVKKQTHATYRTIVGLPDDSLANIGLADPIQYTGQ